MLTFFAAEATDGGVKCFVGVRVNVSGLEGHLTLLSGLDVWLPGI